MPVGRGGSNDYMIYNETMKHLLTILLLTFAVSLPAQNLVGYWEGKIAVSKKDSLTVGLQIDYQGDTLYAELDSPDQYFTGQPVSGLTFADSALSFRVPEFGLSYEGTLSADGQRITGTCKQNGQKFACSLTQGAKRKCFPRPQTPTPPYPYHTEDITFKNRAGKYPLILGTLTLPDSAPKALVIFISGSGWQDRDETIFAHKPFAVIADTLTKAGYATFRYDDLPTAVFRKSTTYDFVDAVKLILDSLLLRPDLKYVKTGLLGHSEGSLVAFMVAAEDPRVMFTIHLGGVAQPIDEILLYQNIALAKASNTLTESQIEYSTKINKDIYQIIKKSKDKDQCVAKLEQYWDKIASQLSEEEKINYNITPEGKITLMQTFSSPFYFTLFHIDPIPYLKKVKMPVLAISGEKDLQVEAVAAQKIMRKYLKDKYHYNLNTFTILQGDNHLLQPCTTGSLEEYGEIETTIDPLALDEIVQWLDFWWQLNHLHDGVLHIRF